VAWKKLQSMKDYFNKGLEENKFVNLGFYEIGMVYVVSTKPVANLQEFKGKKIWAWEGDQLVKAMVDSMGLVSVPLALPDVLSSLSTGIIDSAYAPPSAIIALQWQTRVKYLIDYPVAFSIGALLIDAKAWKKISPVNQKIIQTLAKKYIDQTNKQTILDNQSSLSFLKENGVKFIKFPKEDIERSQPIRKDVISKIKGKVISNAAIEML
jgi:TRAP-type C4-dicarboxylate transport system substrate-binding protein